MLISNNLVSQSLQQGIPGRLWSMTVMEINEQIIEIISNKLMGALDVMKQYANIDLTSHEILPCK